MHTLRHARILARFVLAWFMLSLGAAIASPIVKPQGMTLVCSAAGGLKLLQQTDDGPQEAGAHTLDCPLCSTAGAPPPVLLPIDATPRLAAQAIPGLDAARLPGQPAVSPPPRGPPSRS